jgi:hypothetical protein
MWLPGADLKGFFYESISSEYPTIGRVSLMWPLFL